MPISKMRFTPRVDTTIVNACKRKERQQTIVVVGAPSGGTSSVCLVLDALGVFMGPVKDISRGVCCEWPSLHKVQTLAKRVEKINKEHDVWGFKLAFARTVDEVMPLLRNPVLVVVTRDPCAMATNEKCLEKYGSQLEAIADCHRTMGELFEVFNTYRRSILVPYERAKSSPLDLINDFILFFGLKVSLDQTSEAYHRMRTVPGYLTLNES